MKKILIVDDNELIVEVMSYILTSNGYHVISLNNAQEVVKEIKAKNPDLIILDAILPGVDGRDICRILKHNQATRNLPVIICSGDEELISCLNQEGAPDDVLNKPFDITVLLNKVQGQLAA